MYVVFHVERRVSLEPCSRRRRLLSGNLSSFPGSALAEPWQGVARDPPSCLPRAPGCDLNLPGSAHRPPQQVHQASELQLQ